MTVIGSWAAYHDSSFGLPLFPGLVLRLYGRARTIDWGQYKKKRGSEAALSRKELTCD